MAFEVKGGVEYQKYDRVFWYKMFDFIQKTWKTGKIEFKGNKQCYWTIYYKIKKNIIVCKAQMIDRKGKKKEKELYYAIYDPQRKNWRIRYHKFKGDRKKYWRLSYEIKNYLVIWKANKINNDYLKI